MESATLSTCYADPNFAIISGFFDKFGKMCGVPFPLLSELVVMLECKEGVPQPLAFLHTQLLRKIRRNTTIEKWEKAAVKFCQTNLKDDVEELEKNGYLNCSMELKLRLLRTLLESQFDYNVKFKAAINLLTADELRQKPIGKDLQGRLYWAHLDTGANLKVYREDPAVEGGDWTLLAEDRPSLVKLLYELTGDDTLDLSPTVEPVAPVVDTGQNSSASEDEEDEEGDGVLSEGTTEGEPEESETNGAEKRKLEPKINENNKVLKSNIHFECSEVIEDPVMQIKGVGNGDDCEAGNSLHFDHSFECSEAVEEAIFFVYGSGSGAECDAVNPDVDTEVSTSSQSTSHDRVSTSSQPNLENSYAPDSGASAGDAADSTVGSSSSSQAVADSTSSVNSSSDICEQVESSSRRVHDAVTTTSTCRDQEVSTSRLVEHSSDTLLVVPGVASSSECVRESSPSISISEDNEVDSSEDPREPPLAAIPTDRPQPLALSNEVGSSLSVHIKPSEPEEAEKQSRVWSIHDICGSSGLESLPSKSESPPKTYSSFNINKVLDNDKLSDASPAANDNLEIPTGSDSSLTIESSNIPEGPETYAVKPSQSENPVIPQAIVSPQAAAENPITCSGNDANSDTTLSVSVVVEPDKSMNIDKSTLTVPAIIVTPTTPETIHSPDNDAVLPKIGSCDMLLDPTLDVLSEQQKEAQADIYAEDASKQAEKYAEDTSKHSESVDKVVNEIKQVNILPDSNIHVTKTEDTSETKTSSNEPMPATIINKLEPEESNKIIKPVEISENEEPTLVSVLPDSLVVPEQPKDSAIAEKNQTVELSDSPGKEHVSNDQQNTDSVDIGKEPVDTIEGIDASKKDTLNNQSVQLGDLTAIVQDNADKIINLREDASKVEIIHNLSEEICKSVFKNNEPDNADKIINLCEDASKVEIIQNSPEEISKPVLKNDDQDNADKIINLCEDTTKVEIIQNSSEEIFKSVLQNDDLASKNSKSEILAAERQTGISDEHEKTIKTEISPVTPLKSSPDRTEVIVGSDDCQNNSLALETTQPEKSETTDSEILENKDKLNSDKDLPKESKIDAKAEVTNVPFTTESKELSKDVVSKNIDQKDCISPSIETSLIEKTKQHHVSLDDLPIKSCISQKDIRTPITDCYREDCNFKTSENTASNISKLETMVNDFKKEHSTDLKVEQPVLLNTETVDSKVMDKDKTTGAKLKGNNKDPVISEAKPQLLNETLKNKDSIIAEAFKAENSSENKDTVIATSPKPKISSNTVNEEIEVKQATEEKVKTPPKQKISSDTVNNEIKAIKEEEKKRPKRKISSGPVKTEIEVEQATKEEKKPPKEKISSDTVNNKIEVEQATKEEEKKRPKRKISSDTVNSEIEVEQATKEEKKTPKEKVSSDPVKNKIEVKQATKDEEKKPPKQKISSDTVNDEIEVDLATKEEDKKPPKQSIDDTVVVSSTKRKKTALKIKKLNQNLEDNVKIDNSGDTKKESSNKSSLKQQKKKLSGDIQSDKVIQEIPDNDKSETNKQEVQGRKRRSCSQPTGPVEKKTLRTRKQAIEEVPVPQPTLLVKDLKPKDEPIVHTKDEADPLATPSSSTKDERGTDLDPLALNEDLAIASTPANKGKSKKKQRKKVSTKKKIAIKQDDKEADDEEDNTGINLKLSSKEKEQKETPIKGKRNAKQIDENKEPHKKSSSYYIPAREIQLLGVSESALLEDSPSTVRQSRRIAQIRMKEDAERRRQEEVELQSFKKGSKEDKKKSKTKVIVDEDYEEEEDEEEQVEKGKSKKSKTNKFKKFDDKSPWLNSTDSSSQEEEYEEDEIEEEPEEPVYKSDHEFSPESDVEDPEYQPVRVARTAHARKDTSQDKYDDVSCKVCNKSDRPEWILLCDNCDKGCHADCLTPPLHLVPEGTWFCPPCSLESLIAGLKLTLRDYDRCEKQRENEELRKKRLAFVGISLDNVLPSRKPKKPELEEVESESETESSSEDSSDSSPIYQLRERRSNVTSYRYNEYDELIRSAIREELDEATAEEAIEKTTTDIKEPVNGAQDKPKKSSVGEDGEVSQESKLDPDGEYSGDTEEDLLDEIPAVVPRKREPKKKKKKLTSLEFSSEEDRKSDSDFKGSTEDDDDDEDQSESDVSGRRGRRGGKRAAVRRSTRARRRRYDKDFINDDSSDVSGSPPPRRRDYGSSESSDSDQSWGRAGKRTRRRRVPLSPPPKRKKKNKKKKHSDASDSEEKPKRRRVKYGLDSDSDEKIVNRRTRGRQINYVVDNDASDSAEEIKSKRKAGKDSGESDEEFNAEDEKVDEDEVNEESEEDSEDEVPIKKVERDISPPPKAKVNKAKIAAQKKVSESDSEESDIEADLEDLDDEAEEELLDMLDKGDIPVEQLKAAVKRTKEERKNKIVIPEVQEKIKKGKVKITPTRAEIAEAAAAKAGKAIEEGGLLMRSLQATHSPLKPPEDALQTPVVSPARQGRPAFPSQLQGPHSLGFPHPPLPGGIPVQHPPMAQLARSGQPIPTRPPLVGLSHPTQGVTPPHMMAPNPQIPAQHVQIPPQQGGAHPQMVQPRQIRPLGPLGGLHLHPVGTHHPSSQPPQATGSSLPQMPLHSSGMHPNIPRQPAVLYPQRPPHPQMTPVGAIQQMPLAGIRTAISQQPSSPHSQIQPKQPGSLPQMLTQPPRGPHPPTLSPLQHGGPPSNLPQQPSGVRPLINQQQSMSSPTRMPMGGQFAPHQGPFPLQSSYPKPSASPNIQLSPEAPKQRKKPGPKPGSKNKKKTEEEVQAAAAGKIKPRVRKADEVTIATVQAPTQFPDAGAPEGGSVITRMLNSSQTSAGPAPEASPRFPSSPASTSPAMYHSARPMDPSPSGGAAVTITKPAFPPEGFPPYQNFQQHFPGFPGAAFPPVQGPTPQAPPPLQSSAPSAPAAMPTHAPAPVPLVSGKPFDEEEVGEFGGLASYFASQAGEDMDT